jgi:hypothetical protein
VLAAAALVAAALPSSAQARCRGGCAIGAGVAGFAAGAILGSAIANSTPHNVEPAPVEGVPPADYVDAPGYVDSPVCHIKQRQVLVPGYGWQPRRVEVCN